MISKKICASETKTKSTTNPNASVNDTNTAAVAAASTSSAKAAHQPLDVFIAFYLVFSFQNLTFFLLFSIA